MLRNYEEKVLTQRGWFVSADFQPTLVVGGEDGCERERGGPEEGEVRSAQIFRLKILLVLGNCNCIQA